MSDTEAWQRAYLDDDEQVIWYGSGTQKPPIWMYRILVWTCILLAILFLFFSALALLMWNLRIMVLGLFTGLFFWGIAKLMQVRETNWRNYQFIVTPSRALVIGPQGIVDEVEINAFLHFEKSTSGIHFPRRMGQWPDIDDPNGIFAALKQAKGMHQ